MLKRLRKKQQRNNTRKKHFYKKWGIVILTALLIGLAVLIPQLNKNQDPRGSAYVESGGGGSNKAGKPSLYLSPRNTSLSLARCESKSKSFDIMLSSNGNYFTGIDHLVIAIPKKYFSLEKQLYGEYIVFDDSFYFSANNLESKDRGIYTFFTANEIVVRGNKRLIGVHKIGGFKLKVKCGVDIREIRKIDIEDLGEDFIHLGGRVKISNSPYIKNVDDKFLEYVYKSAYGRAKVTILEK